MTTFRADSIYTKPMDQVGPPVAGTWLKGTTIVDVNGQHWNCVASGTPGTWVGGDTATSPQQMVYVAKNGRLLADGGTGAFENPFLTIQGAIDSIGDASTSKRYVVKVAPGVYAENVTMKSYVTVEGTGTGTTVGWDVTIDVGTDNVNPAILVPNGVTSYINNVLIKNFGTAGALSVISTTSASTAVYLDKTAVLGVAAGIKVAQSSTGAVRVSLQRGSKAQGSTKSVLWEKNGTSLTAIIYCYDSEITGSTTLPPELTFFGSAVNMSSTTEAITATVGSPVQILSMVSDPSAYTVGEIVTDTAGKTGRVKAKRTGTTHELLVVPTTSTLMIAGAIIGETSGTNIVCSAASALCGGLTAYTAAAGIQTPSPTLLRVGPNEKFTTIQSALDACDGVTSMTVMITGNPTGNYYRENLVIPDKVVLIGQGRDRTIIYPTSGVAVTANAGLTHAIYNCYILGIADSNAVNGNGSVGRCNIILENCFVRSSGTGHSVAMTGNNSQLTARNSQFQAAGSGNAVDLQNTAILADVGSVLYSASGLMVNAPAGTTAFSSASTLSSFSTCTLGTRPTLPAGINATYFVTDYGAAGAILTWNGTAWVNALGTVVP